MIVASANGEKKDLLLLGLSQENIDRLWKDLPIRISRETHGEAIPENLVIVIIAGKSEYDIKHALETAGIIGPDTKLTTGSSNRN